MMRSQREELQALLADAVMGLCRSSLKYTNKFSIEGLLGITLDENEVLLVSLKETVNNGHGLDVKPPSGRAIAVAKKRTAKMAGLPGFPLPSQHSPFTATNSQSSFTDFESVTMPDEAFESSPPIKKQCRSPSLGSATPPNFTPSQTHDLSFPNMMQLPGSNNQSGTSGWSPDGASYKLGTISGVPGSSATPLQDDDDDDDDVEVIEDDDDDLDDDLQDENGMDRKDGDNVTPKVDVLKIHRIQRSILLYNGCMVTLRQFLRTSGHRKEEVSHAMVTLTGDQDDRDSYIGEARNCRLTPYVFYKCPPELVKPSVYALYGMSEELYRFRYYSTCRLPSQHPTGPQWDHLVEDILLSYPFNPRYFPLEHMNLTLEGKARLTKYKNKLVTMYERDGSIEKASEQMLM